MTRDPIPDLDLVKRTLVSILSTLVLITAVAAITLVMI